MRGGLRFVGVVGRGAVAAGCFDFVGTAGPLGVSTVRDVSWAFNAESVWVSRASTATVNFRRYDLDTFTEQDAFAPLPPNNSSGHIATDGDGGLWWTHYDEDEGGAVGIVVHHYDPVSEVDTEVISFTEGTVADHTVTGLEWNARFNRIYIAWDKGADTPAAWPVGVTAWHVDSFDLDGSGLVDEASGTEADIQFAGPIVFSEDGKSGWGMAVDLATTLRRVGHLDLDDGTITQDPTSGDADLFAVPGPPVDGGVLYKASGATKKVVFDDPGFTVSASVCSVVESFVAAAYHSAVGAWDPLSVVYLDDENDVWRRVPA